MRSTWVCIRLFLFFYLPLYVSGQMYSYCSSWGFPIQPCTYSMFATKFTVFKYLISFSVVHHPYSYMLAWQGLTCTVPTTIAPSNTQVTWLGSVFHNPINLDTHSCADELVALRPMFSCIYFGFLLSILSCLCIAAEWSKPWSLTVCLLSPCLHAWPEELFSRQPFKSMICRKSVVLHTCGHLSWSLLDTCCPSHCLYDSVLHWTWPILW